MRRLVRQPAPVLQGRYPHSLRSAPLWLSRCSPISLPAPGPTSTRAATWWRHRLGATAAFALGGKSLASDTERVCATKAVLKLATESLLTRRRRQATCRQQHGSSPRGCGWIDLALGPWCVRLVGRQNRFRAEGNRSLDLPTSVGRTFAPGACGWRSPITAVPRSGSRTPTPSRDAHLEGSTTRVRFSVDGRFLVRRCRAGAARLAPRRRPPHAHDRLSARVRS
jgi:hypothetical protein